MIMTNCCNRRNGTIELEIRHLVAHVSIERKFECSCSYEEKVKLSPPPFDSSQMAILISRNLLDQLCIYK
jgi:hypothetical protein